MVAERRNKIQVLPLDFSATVALQITSESKTKMNVRELFRFLVGGPRPGKEPGSSRNACPNESDVLAYIERRSPAYARSGLDSHFAECGDCREFLGLFVRASRETEAGSDSFMEAPYDAEVMRQSAKVLTMIKEDEFKHSHSELSREKETRRHGFYVSLPRLALVAAAVTVVIVGSLAWLVKTDPVEQVAVAALGDAMKTERRTEVRISGGFDYSPHTVTRGGSESGSDNSLRFERVFSKLKAAEKPSAPAAQRLILARAYLARNASGDASRARKILEEVAADGNESAEIDNDKGVALFQLGNYQVALASFTRALEKKPDFYEALFNLALAEERLNSNSDARRDFEKFIKMSPDARWNAEAQRHVKQ